jgi:gluconate kinase
MARRHGHFMPAALLRSQFYALEEPGPDENPIIVSIDAEPSAIAARILAELRIEAPAP